MLLQKTQPYYRKIDIKKKFCSRPRQNLMVLNHNSKNNSKAFVQVYYHFTEKGEGRKREADETIWPNKTYFLFYQIAVTLTFKHANGKQGGGESMIL